MTRTVDPWYDSPEGATLYRRKYERSWLRRLSHRRELALVDRACERAGIDGGRVLDCPCGAGRLVPLLLRRVEHVVAADASEAMVREARDVLASTVALGRAEVVVAALEALPFPDAAFDHAVCHRLLHHVTDAATRARMLGELARVTEKSVVLSFHDATTWKARWQVRRGRGGRRLLISPAALTAEAQAAGLEPEGSVLRLSPVFSRLAALVLRAPKA